MKCKLRIQDLELQVRLGWDDEERKKPQSVRVTVEIRFHGELSALRSDELSGTLCYSELSEWIRNYCQNPRREFRLIENLGFQIYQGIHQFAKDRNVSVAVTVDLHKLHAPVSQLKGGALFSCSDDQ